MCRLMVMPLCGLDDKRRQMGEWGKIGTLFIQEQRLGIPQLTKWNEADAIGPLCLKKLDLRISAGET